MENQIRKLFISIILLAGCVWSGRALALAIPDQPSGRVHDEAQLLSSEQRSSLDSKLAAFEQETSNQIVVATFSSLDDESLEDFSIRLAEKWKIGQKGKDNGIILVIFPQDRRLRIEVGYGLESVVPDAYASRIIEEKIKPNFRKGDFYAGIDQAVDALMKATVGVYEAESKGTERGRGIPLPVLFLLLIFFVPLILLFQARQYGGHNISWRRSGSWSGSGGGGGWSGGGGGFSGGGGSFGGGGSSGSW